MRVESAGTTCTAESEPASTRFRPLAIVAGVNTVSNDEMAAELREVPLWLPRTGAAWYFASLRRGEGEYDIWLAVAN